MQQILFPKKSYLIKEGKRSCLFRCLKSGSSVGLATTEELIDDELVRVVKQPFKVVSLNIEKH